MTKNDEGIVTIEEAISKAGYGKFNYFLIIIAGFILINVVLESVGISFSLPVLNCDLDLNNQENGILGAISFVGIICSSHLWGFLADTTGRRNVIRLTLIAGFFVTLLSSFSPNFWILVVLRFVNGFLLSGCSATIYAYLGEFHTNEKRNRSIMGACFISAIAAILFPVLAWAVINQNWSFHIPILNIAYKPWRLYMVTCGLPGFLCGLCLTFFPESPKFTLSVGKEAETLEILRKMYAINTGKNPLYYEVTSITKDIETINPLKISASSKTNPISELLRSMWYQTTPLFMKEHLKKTILTCLIQFSIFSTAHGVYMWFPLILNNAMKFTTEYPEEQILICDIIKSFNNDNIMENQTIDSAESACVETLEISTYKHTISLEIIYVGVFLCMGWFISKIGRIPTLSIILLGCGSCGIIFIFVNIPMISVYIFVICLLCGLGGSVVNAITVDIYPTQLRAMAVCISLMFGRIGAVAGSNIIGALIGTNCELAFIVPAAALILSGFLCLFIPKSNNTEICKIISLT